jgi:hypothetical protein
MPCYWTAGKKSERWKKFGTQEEVLRVHEGFDFNDVWQMNVEISDIQKDPHTWGAFLADVAFEIAHALAEQSGDDWNKVEDRIHAGFNSGQTFLPERTAEGASDAPPAADSDPSVG